MVSEEREENVNLLSPALCTCMCIVYVYVHCKTYTHTLYIVRHTHIHCLVVTGSNLLTLVASYHLLAVVHYVCVMDYSAYMYCTRTVVILQYTSK